MNPSEPGLTADGKLAVLVNTFYAKPGKLDELIALQVEESARMGEAAHAAGWRGNRILRSLDGTLLTIVTVFESMEAKEKWAAGELFQEHLKIIAPLLERVDSRPCGLVAANGVV